MQDAIERAANLLRDAEYVVALTGAGISKESNVPTFRGTDGLWRKYNPMDLATPQAFSRNPDLVWEWYAWRQNLIASCMPNPAHYTLAEWERRHLLQALITQNVDGLHRRAGSKRVYEVHGNIWAVKCTSCDYRDRLHEPVHGTPRCPECGGLLRPDVVWFGESLDPELLGHVYEELNQADLCLVVGTSAIVQPAASFPLVVKNHGGVIIEVNVEPTPLTGAADLHIEGKAGEVLPAIDRVLLSLS
ncbi:MAG: SIR2 family NAD-dependent protein deacylase [Candidatus Thorarchaeota archaeon]